MFLDFFSLSFNALNISYFAVLDLLVKRKIDSVLQKNPFVQVVPSSKSKPKKSIQKQKDVLKENDST